MWNFYFLNMFIDFRERGKGGERETDRPLYERKISTGCLPYMSQPGIKPTTQVCALTDN